MVMVVVVVIQHPVKVTQVFRSSTSIPSAIVLPAPPPSLPLPLPIFPTLRPHYFHSTPCETNASFSLFPSPTLPPLTLRLTSTLTLIHHPVQLTQVFRSPRSLLCHRSSRLPSSTLPPRTLRRTFTLTLIQFQNFEISKS